MKIYFLHKNKFISLRTLENGDLEIILSALFPHLFSEVDKTY